jgi:hypothetical protein
LGSSESDCSTSFTLNQTFLGTERNTVQAYLDGRANCLIYAVYGRGMDTNTVRRNASIGFLALYAIYGIFGIGMTGLLFSFAIGLIVMSVRYPIELTVAATILSGLVWKVIVERRRTKEGFQVSTGTGDNALAITKKIQEITQKNVFQPSGVLSSSFAEGFADAVPPAPDASAEKPKEEKPAAAASAPAAPSDASVSPMMKDALPSSNAAAAATPPAQPAAKPAEQTAGFTDPSTNGMFKLGSIPADAVGGAHIDLGTTLSNALNALKPDQVKAMTDDTRKLLETQKSLMSMLGTMKPMLQDGKQLMETFTEMFGKQ